MLAAMCKNFLITVVILSGIFHTVVLGASGASLPSKSSSKNNIVTSSKIEKKPYLDPSAFWTRVDEFQSSELNLLDKVVTTLVKILGIPLKKPPPIDGRGMTRLDDRSRTAWYNSLSSKQKRGFHYFNESNQYFDEDPEEALSLIEKCLELYPEYQAAITDRELLRYQLGKPGAPEPSRIKRKRIASVYLRDSRRISFINTTQALDFVTKAIEIDPSIRESYKEREMLKHLLKYGEVPVEFHTKDIASRYYEQSMSYENNQKALDLLTRAIRIDPNNVEAQRALKNISSLRSMELFKEGSKLLEVDFMKGLEQVEKALELNPNNFELKKFMSRFSSKIYDYGRNQLPEDPELALSFFEKSLKYDPKNSKLIKEIKELRKNLVDKNIDKINKLLNERYPDEIKIIGLFRKARSIHSNGSELASLEKEFAKKLHSYAQFYFTDDHRRAIKIIMAVLEADPNFTSAKKDLEKLMKIESDYLLGQMKKIITSLDFKSPESEVQQTVFDLWNLIIQEDYLKVYVFKQNFKDYFYNGLKDLVDELSDKNPKIGYKLLQLYGLRYRDHMQSAVDMKKLSPQVADQYYQQAVEFYDEDNHLALELLLIGLDYDSTHSGILKDIDYLTTFLIDRKLW